MTFLEAAIELLRQTGAPLTVKELTERAIQQGLLTHEGRTPELSMQARLAQELRKGAHTLLVKMNTNTYGLRRYDKPRRGDAPDAPAPSEAPADELSAGVDAPASTEIVEEVTEAAAEAAEAAEPAADAEAAAEGDEKKKRRRRGGRGRKKKDAAPAEAVEAAPPVEAEAAPDPEAGTPEEAVVAEQLADEADAEEAARHVAESARRLEAARARAETSAPITIPPVFEPAPFGDDEPAVDLDGFLAPPRTRRVPVGSEAVASEEDLAAQYGDELGSAAIAPVEGEVVDEQTADEDRPMLEEMTADRGRNRRDRHRRGKERGRESGRERGREAPEDRAKASRKAETPVAAAKPVAAKSAEPRAAEPRAPEPRAAEPKAAEPEVAARPAASLAEAGVLVLKSGDGKPTHARQLATAASKRRLVTGDPEETWKPLRAALVDDSRARSKKGLRARVKAQGPDQFALATAKLEPDLAAIEEQLAALTDKLARETRLTFRRRLARLPMAALETVARLLLERQGYTEIERVKKLEQTTYLSARGKQGALPVRVLISVRAGGSEADRRAVGELRAGVVAKQLDHALLFNTGRIGAEAEKEARQPGAPITVFDGDAFAEALCAAGVGVVSAQVPVTYLDPDFFLELE